ncbi:MoaD/ThiS family protein [Streptomyces sp. NPDC051597]|uniref:MoaD/ThiS family protein n=1 Tax=Streptomyces sp. NPDC051597 TaxID=3155049 RepID=UPI003420FA66
MTFEFNGIMLRAVDNQRTVSVQATNLQDALAELTSRFPQTRRLLLDPNGQLRDSHKVILNGDPLSRPDSAMPLSASDRIEIFTAVAGG